MDMKKMMKQAQIMQKNLNAVQQELALMDHTAESGGGMVSATVNGNMELTALEIKPEAVDPEDVEMLQDLVVAAVNEALRGMHAISEEKMSAVTGGMNIPGL